MNRRDSFTPLVVTLCVLAAWLVTQFGDVLRVPFINDDYIFLDLTRGTPFGALWRPHDWWVGPWYRPWSRELHYWALQQVFGTRETPWHLVSFGLWLTAMGLYFTLVRRLAGTRVGGGGVAGVAALAAWGVPLVWVAGVQELWMLVWALATLQLVVRERWGWAAVTLALALLSKETAVVVPGVALGYAAFMGRARGVALVRKLVPMAAVVLVWAALHPLFGHALGSPAPPHPVVHAATDSTGAPPSTRAATPAAARTLAVVRTPLSALNLDTVPRPEFGWGWTWTRAATGAVLLGGFLAWLLLGRRAGPTARAGAEPPSPTRGVAAFAVGWAALGWLPMLLPALGWHAYYGLLGTLGVWLALGLVLAPRPRVAIALVMALAVLRVGQAETRSLDWGGEWYQRRAGDFLSAMKGDLLRRHPRLAPHTRVFFTGVPSHVGFITGDAPALRVWYADPTLRGGFFRDFRARAPETPAGEDLFFRFDSTAGWVELGTGTAPTGSATWRADQELLAITLSRGGDWAETARTYERLARAFPDSAGYAYYAGLAHVALGDRDQATRWLVRAASLPGADTEIRRAAAAAVSPATGGRP